MYPTFKEWNAENRSREMKNMEEFVNEKARILECSICLEVRSFEFASIVFTGIRCGCMDMICQKCDVNFWIDPTKRILKKKPISQYYIFTEAGYARYWRCWIWMWFKKIIHNPVDWICDLIFR